LAPAMNTTRSGLRASNPSSGVTVSIGSGNEHQPAAAFARLAARSIAVRPARVGPGLILFLHSSRVRRLARPHTRELLIDISTCVRGAAAPQVLVGRLFLHRASSSRSARSCSSRRVRLLRHHRRLRRFRRLALVARRLLLVISSDTNPLDRLLSVTLRPRPRKHGS
jgi:hypothetical protein